MVKTKLTDRSKIISEILNSDQGRYSYLFPYRDDVPTVDKHIFTDIRYSNKKVDEYIVQQMLNIDYIGWTAKYILGLDLFPIQIAIIQTLWKTPFPMLVASRGGSKSFVLAVYSVLRALLDQGSKIVIVGAGLRQAKVVFSYIETIWNNAPVLRSIVGGGKNSGPRQNVDLCYMKIGQSMITALPLGDGQKIRGFRATVIIGDEFASIPQEIFDVVVRGFASTTKSPVEEARNAAINKKLAKLGFSTEMSVQASNGLGKGNQIVYAGTASYRFNHFAKNFDLWQKIIRSKGNTKLVSEIFGGVNNIPENFSYKDYAIMRIPYTFLPDGLLDMRQIANAKATLPKNIFNMEYSALFVKDSDGYFPRSMIELCTVTPSRPVLTPDGEVTFTPMMEGIRGRKYVVGIDPGGERDKLAITVIEVWKNHYRVVYCWSILKSEFNSRKKDNLVKEQDYYEYCCNKIKKIVKAFEPVRIEMDSQGGGYAIAESLRSKKGLDKASGDFPIYEVIDPDNIKETDGESDGPHILNLVKQSNEFNAQANECLYKSLETKRLLFPSFDTIVMHSALMAEKAGGINIDTYEECANNIEELKNEICMIQKSETATGKERFDTPTVLTPSTSEGRQTKGRLRKDRYSSLLISHRFIYSEDVKPESSINYDDVAGNFKLISKEKIDNKSMYTGAGIGSMKNAKDWMSGNNNASALKNKEKI